MLDKEFEEEHSFFTKREEEIEEILETIDKPKIKPSRTLLDLGKKIEKKKVDERLKRVLFQFKAVHDADFLAQGSTNWERYKESWKGITVKTELRYSIILGVDYTVQKKRDSLIKEFQSDEWKLNLTLGFGQKDYEWFPVLNIKKNVKENRFEERSLSIGHNMHCTKLLIGFGDTWDSLKGENVWSFQLKFEIREFPSKKLGFKTKGDGLEETYLGI